MKKEFFLISGFLAMACVSFALADETQNAATSKRVAVHYAGTKQSTYFTPGKNLYIQHGQTEEATNNGKHTVTVNANGKAVTFPAGAIDRITVQDAALPIQTLSSHPGWKVLYGAQNTCGESSWQNIIDGNGTTRVATQTYPGYSGSPEVGNYFWVIDLGGEYDLMSVSAEFRGNIDPYDCAPNSIKVYTTSDTPGELSAENRARLEESHGDTPDEAHKAAYKEVLDLDNAVHWTEMGVASYADQTAGMDPLKVSVAQPVTSRYIKIEVIPFQGKTGDRCFFYGINIEKVHSNYVSKVADKSGWNVVYGAVNTCGTNSWNNIIDGDNATRVATQKYPGYSGSPEVGNYFWVIDLGKEYGLSSVSADFLTASDLNCAPKRMKVSYTNETPEPLTDDERNSLQTSHGDELTGTLLDLYNKMKNLDGKIAWTEMGTAECPADDQVVSYYPLKVVNEYPVYARYIRIEVEGYTGKAGDRCFIHEIDVEESGDDPFENPLKLDQSKWDIVYSTPFMTYGNLNNINDGASDVNNKAFTSLAYAEATGDNYKPFVVFDLGRRYDISAFDFVTGYGDVLPKSVKVYVCDADKLENPVDADVYSRFYDGYNSATSDDQKNDNFVSSDDCKNAMNAIAEYDGRQTWKEVGEVVVTDKYPDNDNANKTFSYSVTDSESHIGRYVKFEFIPLPSETEGMATGDYRINIREVGATGQIAIVY